MDGNTRHMLSVVVKLMRSGVKEETTRQALDGWLWSKTANLQDLENIGNVAGQVDGEMILQQVGNARALGWDDEALKQNDIKTRGW